MHREIKKLIHLTYFGLERIHKSKLIINYKNYAIMKKFIILIFGFEDFQVNYLTKRPHSNDYSFTFIYDFACRFTKQEAIRALDSIESKYNRYRYEIIEVNSLNFERNS